MEQKKKTSDELTPEDKEAFRFYFSQLVLDGQQLNGEEMFDLVELLVKEEKRRLNVS